MHAAAGHLRMGLAHGCSFLGRPGVLLHTWHAMIQAAIEVSAEYERRPDCLAVLVNNSVYGMECLNYNGSCHERAHVRCLGMEEKVRVDHAQCGVAGVKRQQHADLACG